MRKDSPDSPAEQPGNARSANSSDSDGHLSDADVAVLLHGDEPGRTGPGTTPSTTLHTAPSPTLELQRHAESCDACRRRVAKARVADSASALMLSLLDVPAPVLDAASVLARARERGRVGQSRAKRTFSAQSLATPPKTAFVPGFVAALVPFRAREYRYALAASFLFAAIGVTAMAFPGSPLRRLWEDARQKSGAATVHGVQNMPRADPSSDVGVSSVATAPAPDLTIDFHGPGVRLPRLTVRYCDTTLATLRVLRSGAPSSTASGVSSGVSPTQPASHPERFSVSADRIVVTQDASAAAGEVYELSVPNSTRSLSVTAGGTGINVRRLPIAERHKTDGCDAPIAVAWTA